MGLKNILKLALMALCSLATLTVLASCSKASPTATIDDQVRIYATVVKQLIVDFGARQTAYILNYTLENSTGTPAKRNSKKLSGPLQKAILADLEGTQRGYVWVSAPQGKSVLGVAACQIIFGNIHRQKDGSVEVTASVSYGDTGGGSKTYILKGIWTVTGTVFPSLVKISPDNNPLPAFKWTASANADSYEVRIDSGNWLNVGSNLTYIQPTILSKGTHIISIRAKGSNGKNSPEASLSFDVSVEANLANTRIAYASGIESSGIQIYTITPDFSDRRQLTDTGTNYNPMWSPDGSKIVFSSRRDGSWRICVMNSDGSGQTQLTSGPGDDQYPSWSPDGLSIAFGSNRNGNYEIYRMNADGTEQTRLLANPGPRQDYWPRWSPDGTQIVFFDSNASGTLRDIFVINSDGSRPGNLTGDYPPTVNDFPSWSPDGTRIAFESFREHSPSQSYGIYLMDRNGFDPIRITPAGIAAYGSPVWSPDGTRIAFIYEETISGPYTIATISANGTGLNILNDGNRPNILPSWSPFLTAEN